jgi:hypothetical protein
VASPVHGREALAELRVRFHVDHAGLNNRTFQQSVKPSGILGFVVAELAAIPNFDSDSEF